MKSNALPQSFIAKNCYCVGCVQVLGMLAVGKEPIEFNVDCGMESHGSMGRGRTFNNYQDIIVTTTFFGV